MSTDLPMLCDLDDAKAIAAQLPADAAWAASTDGQLTAALVDATMHVCGAMRYQGRKYDPAQELEFPRIVEPTAFPNPIDPAQVSVNAYLASRIWDWDAENDAAVVPVRVKLATVKQAMAIRRGEIAAKRDRLDKGLTSVTEGPFSQSFAAPAPGSTANLLTSEAMQLLQKYRLRTGGML